MEIKKAWEQMKKDIKKELGINGGFTMTAKQIKNRTATYSICNTFTYEWEIEHEKESNARVQSYTSWTAGEKAVAYEHYMENIKHYEEELKKYGTKECKAQKVTEAIVNSNAFKKFQQEVGKVEWHIEQMDICYYIRFNY